MSKLAEYAQKAPRYWKAIIASLPAIVLTGNEVVQAIANGSADGTLDAGDVLTIIFTAVTAYGVYRKANVETAGKNPF